MNAEQENEKRLAALRELSDEFLIEETDLSGLETPIQIELYYRILDLQEKRKQLAQQVSHTK